jgi:[glutamine synthetase] adenylyltransferase / [glutamine synthetase]-adenylyl-L-tyrosine phosphorylase
MSQATLTRELLDGSHGEADARALLAPANFEDWRAASRCLLRMAPDAALWEAFSQFFPHLLVALSNAAGPDRVLANLDRLVSRMDQPLAFFQYLAHNPRAVEILVTLFAGSQFLTEILLRNPAYFERLVEYKRMAVARSAEQLYSEAQEIVAPYGNPNEKLDALRRFQCWELLRIGACDLLDLYDLPAVTRQLSNLADSLIRSCLKITVVQSGAATDDLTILAMGKLGGRELNYSSDIDLLFLSNQDPVMAQKVGERLIDALTRVTDEGFLYRVDMRLRPWGEVGPLVTSLEGHLAYLEKHARPWEKQALLKARMVAGSQVVSRAFLLKARPFLFGATYEQLRAGVFAMKQKTEAQLRQNGRAWGEVKLGEGSIRDIEFTVQLLQLAYGDKQPEILSANTLDALARLTSFHLISAEETRILTDGYTFLRTVEHHLQMMDYRQTHSLPQEPQALAHLARRLGFHGDQPGEQFLARYHQHVISIRTVFLRYVGGTEMSLPPDPALSKEPATPPDVHRHVDRMAPSYTERFRPEEIARHAYLAGQLNHNNLVEVDARPLPDDYWQATIVAYDYPGELSIICGLMFVYRLNIYSGDAFTYEPVSSGGPRPAQEEARRKIVDVFIVRPIAGSSLKSDIWVAYQEELADFLSKVRAGERREAQGELAVRVATGLQKSGLLTTSLVNTLYPIEIRIDNETSDQYTLMQINALDTFGFLFEFTNALALNHIYIDRMTVDSTGNQVQDTFYVTDEAGRKITDPNRQRELRTATVLIKHFSHLLPLSPNPESALLHFEEFIGELFKQPNWPDELASLQRPEVLDALARLLGVSDFLWDDFLRMQHANLFPVVQDVDGLSSSKTISQLREELASALRQIHNGPQYPSENALWIEALNAFKDRQMFRIDMRHILGYTPEFWDFASELTDLTGVVVNSVFHLCHEDLRLVYGTPLLENGQICQMSVVALGKFGGSEMGFASDVELMFIYTGNGRTSGPNIITSTEFYEKLVQNFVTAIRARREGIFQIDLQLRPYGSAGSLSVSLDAFRRYFAPGGPAWAYERQALVRLRPVAGNEDLGQGIARLRDEFVYTGETYNVTAMRAMRERQVRHLVKGGTFNPKFSPGGLVDVEYLIQGLQINYGRDLAAVRQTNTRQAMAALAEAGILSPEDYTNLRKAHTFLRWLIDSLRVVRGNAKDVTMPGETTEEFAFLARRMNYGESPALLHSERIRYTENVLELNSRLLGAPSS